MSIKVDLKNKAEQQKFILITIIGLMDSLINNVITIVDVENALFSPYTVSILRGKQIDEDIIELIELGCELEDIDSILPDRLEENILTIKTKAMEILSNKDVYQNIKNEQKWLVKD